LILALDTSSAAGSAAVVRDQAVLAQRTGDPSRTHGERLPRELMSVLDDASVGLHAIEGFAVSIGPGSFTGLRVGIATIQGLALAQNKLVVPVSTFEALAFGTPNSQVPTPKSQLPSPNLQPRTSNLRLSPHATAVWIDAHRGEVFAALYAADGIELAKPTSLTPVATLDAWTPLLAATGGVRFVGDGAVRYRDAITAHLGADATIDVDVPPLAGRIGIIAAANFGRAGRPHAVVPLYVRRPDAELARDRRGAREPRES
jgi:tRNA threonylcarbamoyladenosine biosynthesis protein TsaB